MVLQDRLVVKHDGGRNQIDPVAPVQVVLEIPDGVSHQQEVSRGRRGPGGAFPLVVGVGQKRANRLRMEDRVVESVVDLADEDQTSFQTEGLLQVVDELVVGASRRQVDQAGVGEDDVIGLIGRIENRAGGEGGHGIRREPTGAPYDEESAGPAGGRALEGHLEVQGGARVGAVDEEPRLDGPGGPGEDPAQVVGQNRRAQETGHVEPGRLVGKREREPVRLGLEEAAVGDLHEVGQDLVEGKTAHHRDQNAEGGRVGQEALGGRGGLVEDRLAVPVRRVGGGPGTVEGNRGAVVRVDAGIRRETAQPHESGGGERRGGDPGQGDRDVPGPRIDVIRRQDGQRVERIGAATHHQGRRLYSTVGARRVD